MTQNEFNDFKKDAILTLNASCNRRKFMQKGDLKSLHVTATAMLAIKNYKY